MGMTILVATTIVLAGLNFAAPKVVYRSLVGLQRRLAGLRTRRLRVDGHDIVYLDGGRGDPLLLVHGFGADCDAWPLLAMHLNQRFRVSVTAAAVRMPATTSTTSWRAWRILRPR